MGQQKGALKLRGTHGDFTFAETQDGFIWKKKRRSLGMDRINTDPKLEKLKNHLNEFSRSGKAVNLVRAAFQKELDWACDGRLTSRLQAVMVKVTKSDTVSERGNRAPQNGDFTLLEKFEMNGHAGLLHSMSVQLETSFDRTTGEVVVNIPAFIPKISLKRAPNVTHYKIVAAAAELDITADKFIRDVKSSAVLPITATSSAAISLKPELTPGSALPVMIVVAIQFSEELNGFSYPERHGEFNALCIVKTDTV